MVTVKENAAPTGAVAVLALVKAGAWPTTIVSVWLAVGSTPFAAVTVMLVVPVAVGVPEIRAVPLPSSAKDNPAGMAPLSVMAGVGEPVVVMATAPEVLSVKSAAGKTMVGAAAEPTVIVRSSVDVLPEMLVAEIVTGYVPAVPLAGVPEMVAAVVLGVPALKVEPGREGPRLSDGRSRVAGRRHGVGPGHPGAEAWPSKHW